ncbi:uncharacterized protein J4E88_008989 [Alternaria novae-zelandiae]|uniref:uncharacterized protein n=1 Tax=Alternaria novae-zelandiae TaxID=430562 RepID=UPI0020C39C41|nr:uncharacterized protein J4E88_008989 [Alternaria novae-zelandiae]KAI4673376.1 hypothetical protein J4E88_008989 [Alternaria novae-zelandiae]
MSAPEEQSESDRDQITQQNAKSPLLRLPAELRNQIFALALTQPIIEIFWSRARWRFMFSEDCRPDYVRQPLNLLFVCRQTHAETATLPYKLNTFAVDFVYQQIRNMIFAYTLSHGDIELKVIPRIINGPSPKGCWKHRNWANPFDISLLYACRQIYFETALLPYELNVFVVFGNDSAFQDFFAHRTLAQLPDINTKFSMSTHVKQQQDTSSSMLSDEMRPEEMQIAEELKIKALREEKRLSEITYLNATTSPLLLLPAEIRNMVFAFALGQQYLVINNKGTLVTRGVPVHLPRLLYVCRQIYAETALLPYALNIFAIWDLSVYPLPTWGSSKLYAFLERRTPAQIEAMTEVMRVGYAEENGRPATEWMKTEYDAFMGTEFDN